VVKATTEMLELCCSRCNQHQPLPFCLKNVSRHPFLPGSLELENDSIVVQEIVEEMFRKFAGNTCLLFGCCPNVYPKATEHIP